jgi:hypothetical protein
VGEAEVLEVDAVAFFFEPGVDDGGDASDARAVFIGVEEFLPDFADFEVGFAGELADGVPKFLFGVVVDGEGVALGSGGLGGGTSDGIVGFEEGDGVDAVGGVEIEGIAFLDFVEEGFLFELDDDAGLDDFVILVEKEAEGEFAGVVGDAAADDLDLAEDALVFPVFFELFGEFGVEVGAGDHFEEALDDDVGVDVNELRRVWMT